jgi:hypothetical protein
MKYSSAQQSLLVAAAIISTVLATKASAQESGKDAPVPESLEEFFGPFSPTFSLIGATDNTIIRPETPKALAAGLLNALDEEGNLKNGLAIELTPGLLFAPRDFDLTDYQKQNWLRRSLTNLQLTVGFAKGSSDDDKSLKAAAGLVWTPINGRDVKAPGGRSKCITDVRGPIARPDGGIDDAAAKAAAEEIAKCKKDHPIRRDNTTTLQFAFSPLFVSPDGSTDKLRSSGYAATGTLMLGLSTSPRRAEESADTIDADTKKRAERRTLLTVTGFYRSKEQVADPAIEGAFLIRNRWSLASRLQFALKNRSYLGIETAYQKSNYKDGRNDRLETIIATYDFRVAENIWATLNAGTSFDKSIGRDAAFVGTRFRFSFASSSKQGGLF